MHVTSIFILKSIVRQKNQIFGTHKALVRLHPALTQSIATSRALKTTLAASCSIKSAARPTTRYRRSFSTSPVEHIASSSTIEFHGYLHHLGPMFG